mmetsp:Transcript_24064/g.60255  ORF Transcript_24064/g.60255 Transcript_24064/m.60255 type:complete len:728 (-) Transcript_24064:382-2565(-)|eukprot:CAMPEP_0177660234 /NCGR_PEP_ID=MMETSP0447-20121125/17916_1 /TAXON_ID=0 /ORGANISM="Stygamoeba regulata, Strain BSH-02190019" /LENGTH=727 /DNA_ID=CAMNT_0019165255 /DNA_START=40 /DNA_END=2223 /DNA_ORIENTATION=+
MAAQPPVTQYTHYKTGPLTEGLLSLDIVSGINLVAKDSGGTSDPYVIYSLVRASETDVAEKRSLLKKAGSAITETTYGRTQVIKKTLNPEWGHEATMDVPTGEWHLLMQVYDYDRVGGDDFMGEARMELFQDGKSSEQVIALKARDGRKDRVSGDLVVRVFFVSKELASEEAETNTQAVDPVLELWEKADRNKDGSLSLSEIRKILEHLNVEMSSKELAEVFSQVDEDNSGELDFKEFGIFLELLCEQPLVTALYTKLGGGDELSEASFASFLREEQKEATLSDAEIQELMQTAMANSHQKKFNLQAFAHFLGSPANAAFNPAHATVFQDTSLPLNAYWMNSSHNTYLVGDQLKGRSEVEQYKRVMDLGCRCVELDCWDGKGGEPIVFHGHTLTSKIYFEDVCKAIAEHAFSYSPFPVVLSLENHTGRSQQKRMAEHLKTHLSHLMPPNFQDLKTVPSLEELKNKVLIKCSASVHPDLAVLIHLASTKYEPEKEKPSWKITSFAEGSFKKMGKKSPADAVSYTNRHMARLYPAGNRVNSSNYDPSIGWACGVQLVALNFQTNAMPIYLNQIRFRTNGNCGYVLKPENLRSGAYDPSSLAEKKTLRLTVMSGFKLPKLEATDTLDPYVVVRVHGGPVDDGQVFKTKRLDNNGLNPVWDETFDLTIANPEISIVTACIMDQDKYSKDDFVAYWGSAASSLREGVRSCRLHGADQKVMEGSHLLLKCTWL